MAQHPLHVAAGVKAAAARVLRLGKGREELHDDSRQAPWLWACRGRLALLAGASAALSASLVSYWRPRFSSLLVTRGSLLYSVLDRSCLVSLQRSGHSLLWLEIHELGGGVRHTIQTKPTEAEACCRQACLLLASACASAVSPAVLLL